VFTDPTVGALPYLATVIDSLRAAGIDAVVFDAVAVEPTDASFLEAIAFAVDGRFDGYVSVGGGSSIDTAKAANLYATHPADLLDYVNAPVGAGRPVPGPLLPHIACPTTSGTGSECTGIAIFDLLSLRVKTGIASPRLRPSLALVDPTTTHTLPAGVVASSGLDVLAHALESYTARPYTQRPAPAGAPRPMSQGANPWSDVGCQTALDLIGGHFVRAVLDPADHEARHQMMWAATLAGIAFGNAGVHIPHAMAYSIAGLVRDFHPDGYPSHEPMVPHGMSVILGAPAAFRLTAPTSPRRHLHGAELLGADVTGASDADAGEVLAARLLELMRATGMPAGLAGVGYSNADVPALVAGAWAQQRLLTNAPLTVDEPTLSALYRASMAYA
jgi:alcohol dehydrogenase class IV